MAEIINRVNWVDLIALILLIRVSYTSLRVGVGKQILPFILLLAILVIPLYAYRELSSPIVEKYLFSQSLCEFLTYVVLTLALFVIYYVISRLVGFCISQDKGKTAAIEKIGGATFGVVRSVIIIGIFVTGFILTPSKFVEKSVKDSFTGVFFININLRIYNTAMDLVFRDDKISHRKTLEQFISEKKDYPFKTLDLREKSKFFKKEKEE